MVITNFCSQKLFGSQITNFAKKNGDVTHSEEEIGPAGVQVDRQLDKWAAISWKYMQLHAVHENFSDDHPNCETLDKDCLLPPFPMRLEAKVGRRTTQRKKQKHRSSINSIIKCRKCKHDKNKTLRMNKIQASPLSSQGLSEPKKWSIKKCTRIRKRSQAFTDPKSECCLIR